MDASETLVAITGMMVVFGMPLLLVAIVLLYKHRQLRMTHDTILKLAERGVAVPPELLRPPRRRNSGLRGGLVLIGLGIGLSLFFLLAGTPAWPIGLIPGLMGVALLIAWRVESNSRDKAEPPL
jgi:hypothetical protein